MDTGWMQLFLIGRVRKIYFSLLPVVGVSSMVQLLTGRESVGEVWNVFRVFPNTVGGVSRMAQLLPSKEGVKYNSASF